MKKPGLRGSAPTVPRKAQEKAALAMMRGLSLKPRPPMGGGKGLRRE